MYSIQGKADGRLIIVRLDRGDDLLEGIRSAAEAANISNGYVVSGIGTLSDCVMHMVTTTTQLPVETFPRWHDKALEVASIDGIIADGVPHLHMVISDDKSAWAGHMEPGCRVLYLAEIVIAGIEMPRLHRVKDEYGINKLAEKE